jgi:hypothetical protein
MACFANATNRLLQQPLYPQITIHSTILAEKLPGTIA